MTEQGDIGDIGDIGGESGLEIAIIGMTGRFPGAGSLEEFWAGLAAGREAARPVTDEEYLAAGGDPGLLGDPYLVKIDAAVEDIDLFDAGFFGVSAAEAELMDPQHRVFLECAHHVLDQAGYNSGTASPAIGIYAASTQSRYFIENVYPNLRNPHDSIELMNAAWASTDGSLATRVAYALNLTGPAVFVQTACSSSLVAVHLACQDLLSYRCDIALAGGVSLDPAGQRGYRYVTGGPFSPDGRCRAFDAKAAGMFRGNGAGVVAMKRLADAQADGDHIRAVIKGSAVNNDGNRKVGFAAPSVQGQAEAILAAHTIAGISADSVGYIEAHGTATPVGDPIEVSALSQAFAATTQRKRYCAIGSVKTNIGHLDAAAGIAGLIKTVLALEHGQIPPSLHFTEANPLIDFDNSPFYVSTELAPWRPRGGPRRAGVSSFGIGGTNAHVVVEEAPPAPDPDPGRRWTLVTLSAKTPSALDTTARELAAFLGKNPEVNLSDVAHTLQAGRRHFPYRRFVVSRTAAEAANALTGDPTRCDRAADEKQRRRPVVFQFPGLGSQYAQMGHDLYRCEPVFRAEIDRCAAASRPILGADLRTMLYGPLSAAVGFPAIVATEYALAKLLMSWGIRPQAMIGHSLGEYTAACLSGVLSLEDTLRLVTIRERLIERAAGGGAMVAVALAPADAERYLTDRMSLAAVNGHDMIAVSGPADDITGLEARLEADGIECHRLHAGSAAHSWLLDSILPEYGEAVSAVRLCAPRIPYISDLTGTWISAEEATDPGYWARHTRETVRFADGLDELCREQDPILLEVGPGNALTKLARRHLGDGHPALPSMRHARAVRADDEFLLDAVARLWLHGIPVEWAALYPGRRRRMPLPGHPFERQRHWIDPPGGQRAAIESAERRLRAEINVARTPDELRTGLDRLCVSYVCDYLRSNGIELAEGRVYRRDQIARQLNVVPSYQKMLDAFLRMLADERIITLDDDCARFLSDGTPPDEAGRLSVELAERFPDYAGDLEVLGQCASRYSEVLTGTAAGVGVLLPGGSVDSVRSVIDNRIKSSDIAVYRPLIAEQVARLAASSPRGRTLKILEVGGGAGYLTWLVAERLRGAGDLEYHFTDIGRSFVLDAQREAAGAGLDFMTFGVLDIARDPVAQGYQPGDFDIVLAFNVLHATPDVRLATRAVRTLLRPQGTLFLLEACRPTRWSTMTSGLAAGWWFFDDDLRRHSPLLPPHAWATLLREESFGEVIASPGDDHALIVAQLTGQKAAGTWSAAPAGRPAAFNQRPQLETQYVPAQTETERTIARIWQDVLGIDSVGIHDDFFDLGGDSLLGMQLITRAREAFGIDLSMRNVFDKPTIAAMVTAIEAAPAQAHPITARPRRAATT